MAILEKIKSSIMNSILSLLGLMGIFNGFSGIVAGIWLMILGEWGAFGTGIFLLIFSTFIIGFVLIPGMLFFTAPAMRAIENGRKVTLIIFTALSLIYTTTVITVWCLSIMFYFVNPASEKSIIPIWLWSYGIALGPWMYMASKDGNNEYSTFLTIFAETAYIVSMVMYFINPTNDATKVTFIIIMVIGLITLVSLAVITQNEEVPKNRSSSKKNNKFYWFLFPPEEVTASIAEVKLFFDRFETKNTFLSGLTRDVVQKKAIKAIRDEASNVITKIRTDNFKPQQVALLTLMNLIFDELSSGEHNVYRGLLSMSGTSMRACFNYLNKELQTFGYITEDDAKRNDLDLSEAIKMVG